MKQLIPILSILLCFACSEEKEKTEESAKKSYIENRSTMVDTMVVKEQPFWKELVSNGTIEAGKSAVVPFEIQEFIEEVLVNEGQYVQKGHILATLDSKAIKQQLEVVELSLTKARIDYEDQLLTYGYTLNDSASIPEKIIKTCRIKSGLDNALLQIKLQQEKLKKCTVKAPISGVICNLQAKAKNFTSSYKNCCEIKDNRNMIAEFIILEGELPFVKVGQEIELTPFALPNFSTTGIIQSVNPSINQGTIGVKAEVKNSDKTLLDGMNIKVLVRNTINNVIAIPKSAVLYRQDKNVVFTLKNDSLAWWTYVETGLENSKEVVITDSSIKIGDTIIVSNNLNLAHESLVIASKENR